METKNKNGTLCYRLLENIIRFLLRERVESFCHLTPRPTVQKTRPIFPFHSHYIESIPFKNLEQYAHGFCVHRPNYARSLPSLSLNISLKELQEVPDSLLDQVKEKVLNERLDLVKATIPINIQLLMDRGFFQRPAELPALANGTIAPATSRVAVAITTATGSYLAASDQGVFVNWYL